MTALHITTSTHGLVRYGAAEGAGRRSRGAGAIYWFLAFIARGMADLGCALAFCGEARRRSQRSSTRSPTTALFLRPARKIPERSVGSCQGSRRPRSVRRGATLHWRSDCVGGGIRRGVVGGGPPSHRRGEIEIMRGLLRRGEGPNLSRRCAGNFPRAAGASFELRAAMGLVLLGAMRGRASEAHDLLAPRGWFTEGFADAGSDPDQIAAGGDVAAGCAVQGRFRGFVSSGRSRRASQRRCDRRQNLGIALEPVSARTDRGDKQYALVYNCGRLSIHLLAF